MEFRCLNDYSATTAQMQTTVDPYPASVVSLAPTGQGEIERIRYVIQRLSGWTQWYAHTEANATFARGNIFGLTLSNNASDATNDIDIATGQATSSAGTQVMTVATAFTKQLDAVWAVGTNAGGLDTGTIANATYHVHAIRRSDTGVVDAVFSRNPGRAATITMTIAAPGVVTWTDHGLGAGSSVVFTTGALPTGITSGTRYYVIATGLTTSAFQVSTTEGGSAVTTTGSQSGVHTGTANPVLPTSYDAFRRLGSIVRTGGAIRAFVQDGDVFMWTATGILDVNTTNPGTSAVTVTLSVPIGIQVRALMHAGLFDTGTLDISLLLSDLALTDVAPVSRTATQGQVMTRPIASGNQSGGALFIRTNTAAQIRYRSELSGAGTIVTLAIVGWADRRGQDN